MSSVPDLSPFRQQPPGRRALRPTRLAAGPIGLAFVALLALPAWAADPAPSGSEPRPVSFDREIRPILSDTCFACHGPDDAKRKAGLRLDVRESAFAPREDGPAVVPRDPAASGIYRRISSSDPDEQMPPADFERRLTPGQIALIRRWIEQGAPWDEHWSLVAPKRPAAPAVRDPSWPGSPIDAFILARLEGEGLGPSQPAAKASLIRRVTLDLTGLPPTLDEVDVFLADNSPLAYRKLVERLLASPRYGERMAIRWLEAARYADTNGYQTDGERQMWRWRDWVIDALNANLPFDRFTVEQLAGDLLPQATLEQKIATGFNRNHRGNSEGGIIPEEYQVEYVVDRVETMSTVWLGLTLGCARCHDHKYDPVRQKDFYQLFAYFNNVPEQGRAIKVGNSPPYIKAPTADDRRRLDRLQTRRSELEAELRRKSGALETAQARWEQSEDPQLPRDWVPTRGLAGRWPLDGSLAEAAGRCGPGEALPPSTRYAAAPVGRGLELDGRTLIEAGDVGPFGYFDAFTLAAWIKPADENAGTIVSRMTDVDEGDGYSLSIAKGRLHVNLVKRWLDDAIRVETVEPIDCKRWVHVAASYDGSRLAKGIRIYVDGRPQKLRVRLDELNQSFDTKEPLRIGAGGGPAARFRGALDEVCVYDRVLEADEVPILATSDPLPAIRALAAKTRNAAQAAKLRTFFIENRAPAAMRDAVGAIRALEAQIERLRDSFPTVMVMEEMTTPRRTRILVRGQYDRPGDDVAPNVPACLPPATGQPANRLGLARWLVSEANPLTARVAVNRQWQAFFGEGLVRTTEDFGIQGDRPSHPELLDWLATELVRLGWNVKALDRAIVTSAAYRQSSSAAPAGIERDPDNRLLARGPRKRLPAEMVRDQALAAAGLLVERLGGPSVRPYQPAGLWKDLTGLEYKPDTGQGLYRRSLYTFWKRTVAPPSMIAFDAPTRETCTVRETRTNTPLQALNTLNDVTYVEASRKLAERMLRSPGSAAERIERAFGSVLSRRPSPEESRILLAGYQRRLAAFRADPSSAAKLLSIGESPRDQRLDVAELAAHTTVASLIFNLAEAVTKE
jgi:hypothetical protein